MASKFVFTKAQKYKAKARIALMGTPGAGKTFSALSIATGLGKKIAVIDTENGSASKYSKDFDFDHCIMETYGPLELVEAIRSAEDAGYDVVIVDSLSHFWMGTGGALDQVDRAAKRSNSGNSFAAWRDVTPQQTKMIEQIIRCKAHIIVTMRSKTEYVLQDNGKGKMIPTKMGLAPIQREGLEYEADIVAEMNFANEMVVTKSRMKDLQGKVIMHPDHRLGEQIAAWCEGEEAPERPDNMREAGAEDAAARAPKAEPPRAEKKAPELRVLVADHKFAGVLVADLEPADHAQYIADLETAIADPSKASKADRMKAHKTLVEEAFAARSASEAAPATV